jgi:hypothetical protein
MGRRVALPTVQSVVACTGAVAAPQPVPRTSASLGRPSDRSRRTRGDDSAFESVEFWRGQRPPAVLSSCRAEHLLHRARPVVPAVDAVPDDPARCHDGQDGVLLVRRGALVRPRRQVDDHHGAVRLDDDAVEVECAERHCPEQGRADHPEQWERERDGDTGRERSEVVQGINEWDPDNVDEAHARQVVVTASNLGDADDVLDVLDVGGAPGEGPPEEVLDLVHARAPRPSLLLRRFCVHGDERVGAAPCLPSVPRRLWTEAADRSHVDGEHPTGVRHLSTGFGAGASGWSRRPYP